MIGINKCILAGLVAIILQLTGFSQSTDQMIKVADDIELVKLSDNAYIHVSYITNPRWGRVGANGLLLLDGKKAFLLDSPWTDDQTERLISWIKTNMNAEITGFIPNHWHEDCMGGLAYIKEQNIKSYANQMTIDIARSEGLPVPQYGFSDSIELKLGDRLIECYFLGGAHSLDNIVVWIPSVKILFPGCMVKSMGSRSLGNTEDGDLQAYPATLQKLLEKFPKAEIVIPGHGRHGGLDLVYHTLEIGKFIIER